MSGWEWAQWVILIATAGSVGWLAFIGMGSVARLTTAHTHAQAEAVSWKQQCLTVHAYVEVAIRAAESADQAFRDDLAQCHAAIGLAEQRVTGLTTWIEARMAGCTAATEARIVEGLAHVHEETEVLARLSAERHQDHEARLRDVSAGAAVVRHDLARCQASSVLSDQRVTGLTALSELSMAAVRALESWHQAFETSTATMQRVTGLTAGAFNALLQQHYAHVDTPRDVSAPGWRYVLHEIDGSVTSTRKATAGTAPVRIERGHGTSQTWYRLTRIEGTDLIYTPEPQA